MGIFGPASSPGPSAELLYMQYMDAKLDRISDKQDEMIGMLSAIGLRQQIFDEFD